MTVFPETVDRHLLHSLAKKVSEAAYMTAQNHDRYRPLMRYFYRQHMGHQYSHSVEDVFAFMRAFVSAEYSEEQCEQDLQQLCEWGNLVAEQDRGGRTVEEFLRRRLRYTITAYGIAFERLLTELEAGKGAGGSLDPSLLERLAARLLEVEAALAQARGESVDERASLGPHSADRAVYQLWNETFATFDQLGRQASDYLGELHRGQQEDLTDVEEFLAYKDVLIQYLNTFVTGLYDVGDRITQHVRRLQQSKWAKALVETVARYESQYVPSASGLPKADVVSSRVEIEWQSLFRWFDARGGLETLRRRTTAAIERVVRQSQRVMDRRSGLSRRRDLEELAVVFARVDRLSEAHRVASAAWGCAIPRHITGSAEVFTLTANGSVWQGEPQRVELIPVQSVGARLRRRSTPVVLDDERQQRALEAELERRRAERAVWDSLFVNDEIDLGDLQLEHPEARARLLFILSQCLAAPDHSAYAPDGSMITLRPPSQGELGIGYLKAPDGTLALPRFRLRRRIGRAEDRLRSEGRGQKRSGTAAAPSDVTVVSK